MKPIRRDILAIVSSLLLLGFVTPSSSGAEDDRYTWGARPEGPVLSIEGIWSGSSASGGSHGSSGSQPASQNAGNSASSSGSQWIPTGPLCPDGASGALIGCEQALAVAGILGGIPTLAAATGGGGAAPAVDPATLITISDIQSIVADGGTITVNPNRGWVYVNKPVYFESDAVAYTENLTILGNSVAVHLSPQSYTWDPGDGSGQFTSNDPGGPWPNGTVTHAYLKDAKSVKIGLTVTWSASFTVAGTTYPVAGTATSTTQSDPFEAREAEAVLTN